MKQYVLDVSLPDDVHRTYNGGVTDMLVAMRAELDQLPAPGAVVFSVMCSDVPNVELHALDVALDDALGMVTPPWQDRSKLLLPDITGRDIQRKGGA